jgi:aspartate/methionine/tyrosine aminotransferase
MFAPTRYLIWARRFYGQVAFDLATSGIAPVPCAAMPAIPLEGADDLAASWTDLCRLIARHNDVGVHEVVPALGTTQAAWLACAALLSPGDEVLIEAPAYEALIRIAEGCGARVRHFAREASEGFALDAERIARAMSPQTRLVVVTNLHNPTGVRAGDDVLREVAQAVAARGAYLLVDEVYAEFDALTDAGGVFAGSARKLGANVLAVSSLTKCYGLGPERIGWLLGPEDVIARAGDALLASTGHMPRSYMRTARAAFAELPALAVRTRGLLAGKRERVSAWVASKGLGWSHPAAGLFGFVTVPGAVDLTPVIEAAVMERQVIVAPGAFFGVPGGFRLAWSIASDRLDEGLHRLGEALAGLSKPQGGGETGRI